MNTKKMTMNAILIAIGAILHYLTPMLGVPMQPDCALAMLFIIIVLNSDYKTALISGIVVGVFTALTTKTPGGQVPNICDKIITCNVIYFILMPLRNKINKTFQICLALVIGTPISGFVFLQALSLMMGLPGGASFSTLFLAVVVPTIPLNLVIGFIIYKVVERTVKVTGIIKEA